MMMEWEKKTNDKAEVKSIAAERALLVLFIIFYTLFTIMPVHSVFFRMYYNSLCVYRNVIHNIFSLFLLSNFMFIVITNYNNNCHNAANKLTLYVHKG